MITTDKQSRAICTGARTKTLKQINGQYRRIQDYLMPRNRYRAARIVDRMYDRIFNKAVGSLGVTVTDDENLARIIDTPVTVREYQLWR